MDQQPTSPLTGLGERLRAARKERNLSQEKLAQPEFTKSYVSAVERGKARPSLKALELMAGRLGLSVSELLIVPLATDPNDPAHLAGALDLALREIAQLLTVHQATVALARLQDLEAAYRDTLPQIDWRSRYDLLRLRTMAHLDLKQSQAAREAGQAAVALAEEHGDLEAAVAGRDLVATTFFQEGAAEAAEHLHAQCRQSLATGQVHNPELVLAVYQHLIADYRALQQHDQADALVQEAQNLIMPPPRSLESQRSISRPSRLPLRVPIKRATQTRRRPS